MFSSDSVFFFMIPFFQPTLNLVLLFYQGQALSLMDYSLMDYF